MGKFIDMSGFKFERLTVIKPTGIKKRGVYQWECLCECGKIKITCGNLLRSGHTKSCGCLFSPNENQYLKNLEVRLLKYSHINEKNGCREWTVLNRTTGYGYGFINFRSKQMMAHRAAWIVWKGKIPNKLHVLHKCDNALCINPDHLFLGTHQDNMNDMKIKKRQNNQAKASKGEKNGSSKLTENDVNDIRLNFSANLKSMKELSFQFKVSQQLIGKIVRREIWTHVIDPVVADFLNCSKQELEKIISDTYFWSQWAKDHAKQALELKQTEE